MPLMFKEKESIMVHDSQIENAIKRGWSLEKVATIKNIKTKKNGVKNGDS